MHHVKEHHGYRNEADPHMCVLCTDLYWIKSSLNKFDLHEEMSYTQLAKRYENLQVSSRDEPKCEIQSDLLSAFGGNSRRQDS